MKASFQLRVWKWVRECFGLKIAEDKVERNIRFYEEATELIQANGIDEDTAIRVLRYVYARKPGYAPQEVGGVMTCLAALCCAHKINMIEAAEEELERINQPAVLEKIRTKQAAKPKLAA